MNRSHLIIIIVMHSKDEILTIEVGGGGWGRGTLLSTFAFANIWGQQLVLTGLELYHILLPVL